MANVTMTYGSYDFSPVPMMSINRVSQKTADNSTILGETYSLSLEGTLTPLPDNDGGLIPLDNLKDDLSDALYTDGEHFVVECDAVPVFDTYPIINSVNYRPTSNNWVFTIDYTIDMEFSQQSGVSGVGSPYLDSADENWGLEVNNEKFYYDLNLNTVSTQYGGYDYTNDTPPHSLLMTHTVNAKGKTVYVDGVATVPWQEARTWVNSKIGYDTSVADCSGVINMNMNDMSGLNHVRSKQIDELGGTYSVTENWVLLSSGSATEDFTINVQKSIEDNITRVNIEGSIQGLEIIDYGSVPPNYSVTQNKYDAAVAYWATIQNKLLPRCQFAAESVADHPIYTGIINRSIGHGVAQGTLSYSYEYDDRPSNCISGALSELITINDVYPHDVFAALVVPGRAAGPVLQDINTSTIASKDISVELIVPIYTGCTASGMISSSPQADVNTFLCGFEQYLGDLYAQVFKHGDTESWNPKNGHYSRSIGWSYQDCSGTQTTSVC